MKGKEHKLKDHSKSKLKYKVLWSALCQNNWSAWSMSLNFRFIGKKLKSDEKNLMEFLSYATKTLKLLLNFLISRRFQRIDAKKPISNFQKLKLIENETSKLSPKPFQSSTQSTLYISSFQYEKTVSWNARNIKMTDHGRYHFIQSTKSFWVFFNFWKKKSQNKASILFCKREKKNWQNDCWQRRKLKCVYYYWQYVVADMNWKRLNRYKFHTYVFISSLANAHFRAISCQVFLLYRLIGRSLRWSQFFLSKFFLFVRFGCNTYCFDDVRFDMYLINIQKTIDDCKRQLLHADQSFW